jgi:hypothetical protein
VVTRRSFEQKKNTLKAWILRRQEKGSVVTADDLVTRIKKNWPTTSEEELERLYQTL